MSEDTARAEGIAILLWAAGPDAPQLLATPFAHAAAAAAMDLKVEVYFSGRSVELLVPGVAQRLRASAHSSGTILDGLRQAVEQGAVLLVCSEALAIAGIAREGLIEECGGWGGTVQFVARVADARWGTLVF